MPEPARPRVLFVDDEPDLLAGLVRTLRSEHFVLVTATSGAAALDLLQNHGPFAVIVSDLRMPAMDGVDLLGRARAVCPETVRILFTGQLDMDKAIAAVNEGAIFRFITKPCSRVMLALTLKSSVEQYRLVTAQRVLLQQTLHGTVQALTDILALANPLAFGRADRLRQAARELVSALHVDDGWEFEVAAMLSQVGWVALPPAVLKKVHERASLSRGEEAMIERIPKVAEDVLGNIPRLEGVRNILRYQAKHFDGSGDPLDSISGREIPWGARALKLISDVDDIESEGTLPSLAIDALCRRAGWYDPDILEALTAVCKARHTESWTLPVSKLRPGMILGRDIRASDGALLVMRGQEVTRGLQEKFRNFTGGFLGGDSIPVILQGRPDMPAGTGPPQP